MLCLREINLSASIDHILLVYLGSTPSNTVYRRKESFGLKSEVMLFFRDVKAEVLVADSELQIEV